MAKDMSRPTFRLLPDLEGEVVLEQGMGLCAAGEDFLSVLAQTMDASGEAPNADVMYGVRRRARDMQDKAVEADWRGLAATVLLWDTWAEPGAQLDTPEVKADTPFAAMILAARRPSERGKMHLVTLSGEGARVSLGLVHDQLGVLPAASPSDLSGLLPERVTWYDQERKRFVDPSALLNERDRAVLIRRLNLLPGEEAKLFASALLQEGLRHSRVVAAQEENALADLSVRALAVFGLKDTAGFECREERYQADPAGNPVLNALGMAAPVIRESFGPQRTWLWQGAPFARSSSATGFEPTRRNGEEQALAAVAAECSLMTASSAWQRQAAKGLKAWISRCAGERGFSPAAREQLWEIARQAEAGGERIQENVTLQWPWPETSAAAAYVVQEVLGESFVQAGSNPFSDKLTLLPHAAPDALGDPALCVSCSLPLDDTGMPCMALPPLSREMAMAAAEHPECLLADSFCMQVTELGAVEASFTLQGKHGQVTFLRVYDEADIVLLQPDETPTVAVWPSVAFPQDQWKAYHVYTHGHGLTVSTPCRGQWICDDEHLWSVVKTEAFPSCLSVSRDGVCLGALPNQLPVFRAEMAENAVIALDMGVSATSAAIRQGEKVTPVQLPCLVRTLLHGSRPAPFDREFLPAEPLQGVWPSTAALFRDTENPVPLVDGHAGSAQELECVRTSLKWSAQGPDRKVCLMYLQQVMTTSVLCAKMNGARSVGWRVALPADLSPARRSAMLDAVRSLAPVVSQETCMPLNVTQGAAVRCVDADQALAAWMKSSGYQRGGFLSMDVGGGSTAMQLWLRGMSRPCATVHLPMGVHSMLLHTLMRRPEELEQELSALPDETLRQNLTIQLKSARTSRRAFERSMLLLDEALTRFAPVLHESMNAALARGEISLLQSLVLCGFAWLMTTSGLMLERAWQDATVNDRLPPEIPLCMAGNGSRLLTDLPDTLKLRLMRFIPVGMSGDNPVRQAWVIPSSVPKQETAMGALRMTEGVYDLAADAQIAADDSLPAVSSALLRRFLMAFAAEFPQAFLRLWPGMLENDGRLTEALQEKMYTLTLAHAEATPASLALCLEQLRDLE